MAKKLSDKQKEKLIKEFINGKNVNDLVEEFSLTKITITRYLKKYLGEETYQSQIEKGKNSKGLIRDAEISSSIDTEKLQSNKVVKRNITNKER